MVAAVVVVVTAAVVVVVSVVATTMLLPSSLQLPSPSPPEHSRLLIVAAFVHLAVAVIACACPRCGASPATIVIVRARCQGVAPRREQFRECSGKEHRWSQAIEPVV